MVNKVGLLTRLFITCILLMLTVATIILLATQTILTPVAIGFYCYTILAGTYLLFNMGTFIFIITTKNNMIIWLGDYMWIFPWVIALVINRFFFPDVLNYLSNTFVMILLILWNIVSVFALILGIVLLVLLRSNSNKKIPNSFISNNKL